MGISVVITTKNRVEYLQRAVNSVFEQTLKPDELIIVDDFSDVRLSDRVLSDFENTATAHDIRFLYIYNESPKGGNYSRNLGVYESQGAYVHFLDDDDVWLENKIEIQQQVLQKNEKLGIVYTGKQFVKDTALDTCYRKSSHSAQAESIWSGNFIGSTSGVAVRRSVFNLVDGFDECLKSLQDYDLWIRMLKHSEACWDGQFNLIYTVHSSVKGQITGNVDKHIETVNYLLDKYKEDLNALPKKQRSIFESRLQHVLARAYRLQGNKLFFKHFMKSLTLRPSLRTLALIFNVR
ncbi:hypothetical protein PRUB_a2926 [Pseudoalteromonas rubra]|uniref:Glycosyltransferase 2-like domain-containing protein n=1 Tax=Pseudoalteromonas rubra TaxID=43658 RepID=A0A8T0CE89_9GAMM|nr:glycosyltransferase family A protein [Pseudoalteromonas rubra]KAF7788301.1 hypothetical protein PRUB_a2926 [Pseudoalteromonas rubra]